MWLLAIAQALSPNPAPLSLAETIASLDLANCSHQTPCEGTVGGIEYDVSSPTTASFKAGSEWSVWIMTDEFTDEYTCVLRTARGFMTAQLPEVFMTLHARAPTFSVFDTRSEPYPMSQMLFRVDKKPVVSKREDLEMPESRANILLRQMKAGNELRIAYETWPEQYRESTVIDLSGFTSVFNAAETFCDSFSN